jgi:ribosomal protein L11 methyltransferase
LRRWLRITLELRGDQQATAEAALLEAGAVALSLEDAGDHAILEAAPGETPDWPEVRVSAVFDDNVDADAVGASLQQRFRVRASVSRVSDRDAPAPVHPASFGKRLWVVPGTGHALPDAAVAVLLEPGLAFGTGAHPTTALCLQWLDAHPPVGMTVVDYGCGSGILGIAAAKLGADRVICVDHDPQALGAARDNAERNRCLDRITLLPPEAPLVQADLLLANIVARPLLQLAERFARGLATGGHIVLAGLLPEQSDALRAFYLRWFDMSDVVEQDGWVLVTGTRRARAD